MVDVVGSLAMTPRPLVLSLSKDGNETYGLGAQAGFDKLSLSGEG